MERHQWKNGDVVRLKEDNGKKWQISKTNDTYGEWFISEIRECGIAGGRVSTWTLYNKYEFVNNPIDDAQEVIKKEFDKIRECGKESLWSEEDEEFLRRAINATKDAYPMTAMWLKSLKERLKGE